MKGSGYRTARVTVRVTIRDTIRVTNQHRNMRISR